MRTHLKGLHKDSVIGILQIVRDRPQQILGKKNMDCLFAFTGGYMFIHSDTILDKDIKLLVNEYVEKKLEYIKEQYPPKEWYKNYRATELLLLASNNDPEKAFDLFFVLFDEFRKEKGIVFEWDDPLPWEEDGEKQYF